MSNVVIVGGGAGGTALIPILRAYKEINIVGVADVNGKAPALKIARKLNIKTSTNYKRLLSSVDADLIINVTGSNDVSKALHAIKQSRTEIIEGISAKLLFKLVDERIQREEDMKKSLEEQRLLYNIGIMLTSS